MLVTSIVGDLEQVLGGHLRPQILTRLLHVVTQLPVVQTQAASLVGGELTSIEALAEQAVELLDGAFVQALLLHHLVDHGDVQRHHRNRRAGLGNDGFQHRHVGTAAALLQFGIDGRRCAVQVFLGFPQGTMPVDRPGDFGTDIAERHAAGTFGQHACIGQSAHPQLPVFAAHHGDGVVDLLLGGRFHFGFNNGVFVSINGRGAVGLTNRL